MLPAHTLLMIKNYNLAFNYISLDKLNESSEGDSLVNKHVYESMNVYLEMSMK